MGADERGVVDAGMDTGNDQVGGWPFAEAVYAGTETGTDKAGGWTYVVEILGIREAE